MVQVATQLRLVLAWAVLAACARETPLATLQGRTLTEGDFQRHLADLYPADEKERILTSPAQRRTELDRWFDILAITAKARRLGIEREPRFAKAVELMEMRTLARLLTEQNRARIEVITGVSDDDVRRFYEERKGDYLTKPSFTARQVLILVRGNPAFPERGLDERRARAKAQQALRQLRQGQSWDLVARRFSDDLSNNQQGGLIRDARFGYFGPEVEQAVRTQTLGKPGDLVKSIFGFHILQVESRSLDEAPEPLAKIEPLVRERLSAERAQQAHAAFIEPISKEMGRRDFEAGKRDVSLREESEVDSAEVLAEIAGKKIRESDFRWFLKDAFPASQRHVVLSHPGDRRRMIELFLDELTLEAKARKEGLASSPDFIRQRSSMMRTLLTEFVQEHDKSGVFCQCQQSPEERQIADRRYFDKLREEVGLSLSANAFAKPLPNSQSRSPRID